MFCRNRNRNLRKFLALSGMLLTLAGTSWGASDFYVVPDTSDATKFKYVKVSSGNGAIDSSQWDKASAEVTDIGAFFGKVTRSSTSPFSITTVAYNYAQPGDTVYMKAGTYKFTASGRGIHLADSLKIYGGFSGSETSLSDRNPWTNKTILNGEALTAASYTVDNTQVLKDGGIVCIDHYDKSGTTTSPFVILDGLVITKAGSVSSAQQQDGGGVYIQAGTVTINQCTITENKVSGYGGGIYIYADNEQDTATTAELKITNSVISNNTANLAAGGIGAGQDENDYAPKVTMENCILSGNTATTYYGGAAVFQYGADVSMTGCTITGNKAAAYGGGIDILMEAAVTLTNCTITKNTGSTGGAVNLRYDGKAEFINCTITANTATDTSNGAHEISVYDSTNAGAETAEVTMTNTLVWNSAASDSVSAISLSDATILGIMNCVLPSDGLDLPSDVTPIAPVTLSNWKTQNASKKEANGVTHTVYMIEGNAELKALFGAGKALTSVTKDQLGQTRADTPCIGAVEGFAPSLTGDTSYTITASEGTAIDAVKITANGGELRWTLDKPLPAGLKAVSDDNTLTISGTPETGTASRTAYMYKVSAVNTLGKLSATVTITISPEAPVFDQTAISKTFIEGTEIDAITITAISGDNLTWTADSSKLPKGLTGEVSGDNKSFVISGTLEAGTAGSYEYTITAANSMGNAATCVVKITVTESVALSVSELSVNAIEGTKIDDITITATEGENLTWTLSGDLPDGLTGTIADNNASYTISGTPEKGTAGSYEITLIAANSEGAEAEALVIITVSSTAEKAPVLSISELTLNATEGIAIRPVVISAIAHDFTWSSSGNLPDGFDTDSDDETFTISGAPSKGSEGTYKFNVTAENQAGEASAAITVIVSKKSGGSQGDDDFTNYEIPDDETEKTLEEALNGLTSEQRAQIKKLMVNENITDLSGLSTLLPNLREIDLSNASGLTEADFSGNTSIKYADLTGNKSITRLVLSSSRIETLDADGCNFLESVNVSDSSYIREINMSNCPAITSFNASGCVNLEFLNIASCGNVKSLNLDGCTNLKELEFNVNAIRQFDARPFTKLEKLESHTQRIRNADLSTNFNLSDFLSVSGYDTESDLDDMNAESKSEAMTSAADSNVRNLKGYDASGKVLSSEYNASTGEYVFTQAPAKITYDYETGFASTKSMDVTITSSNSGSKDDDDTTSISSGGGGCSTGFASLSLLVLARMFLKIKASKR